MAVKVKEHLQMHVYFSQIISVAYDLIWWKCVFWQLIVINNYGDFFRNELVKFVLIILKKNISPFKL